jgi:tetratricopeptide (TPR) repeat protein
LPGRRSSRTTSRGSAGAGKALEVNPDDPEIYYTFAFAYWKTEKYDKALEYTEKAIDHADNIGLENPGLKSDAYNLKGSLLVLRGDREEAIQAFEKALDDELYPRPEFTFYNLASVYIDMKRYPEAQKAAQKSLEHNPHYAPAWKILGQIHVEQGDEKSAIEALGNAIKEFNGYTEAYWDLAQIHIRQGNFIEARRNLNEVINSTRAAPWGQGGAAHHDPGPVPLGD